MFLSSAGLLQFETSFVDCSNRVQFVDFRVDAQILAGSKSKVFEVLNLWFLHWLIMAENCWRKVYSSKFIDELCELRVRPRTVENLISLDTSSFDVGCDLP